MKIQHIRYLLLLLFATQTLHSIDHKKTQVKTAKNHKISEKKYAKLFTGIGLIAIASLITAKIYLHPSKSSHLTNTFKYPVSKFRFQYRKDTSTSYGELIEVLQPENNHPISFETFFKMLSTKEGALDFGCFLKERAESGLFPNGYFLRFPGLSYIAEKGDFQQPCKFLLRITQRSFRKADASCVYKQYFDDETGLVTTFIGGKDNEKNDNIVLICPNGSHSSVNKKACSDIASFVKVHGKDEVGVALFQQLGRLLCFYQKNGHLDDTSSINKKHGKELEKNLDHVFFSTHGFEINWLHLRLDHTDRSYGQDSKHPHFSYLS